MNLNEPKSEMETYGCQEDPEKLSDWTTFQILMMNS